MEASVAEAPPVEASPAASAAVEQALEASHPREPAAANAEASKMFRYSTYMHVGPGAETCEHREDGLCEETGHFHAWCRLPNKFQHRDLYAKGQAARARRTRLLNQDGSDAREMLEAEMETSIRSDVDVETVIDDLLKGEWAQDYILALREVGEREEYEHIQQDRERFMTLGETEASKPTEEQTEEFRELTLHTGQWAEAVQEELARLQEPKRQALREMGREQLVDQLRKRRMTQIAEEVYLHTYNQWEWFICTMKVKKNPATGLPFERYWQEMGTFDDPKPGSMWGEAPEVIDALQTTFDKIERDLQAGVSGNS